ncbi:AAA family ATPase, partial [Streptomyces sp. URMC 123]|uniref:AAA family ATPase n=1 Tax=Streptomyces sp. URMC 123 TaxID=3423403 RepID=UPI003F1BAF89
MTGTPTTSASSRLLGRDHASAVLGGALDRALAGNGGLVLVTGEPGIGKTTLVAEAAEAARRQGALVLGAACWESDGAPGYWPWVQVVRALRRVAAPREWAAAERAAGDPLTALLGEPRGAGGTRSAGEVATGTAGASAGREPGGPAGGSTGGGGGFAVFDAVTSLLVTASQYRPVTVVLDDLHWADPASLRLLAFAARHARFERLLLMGTYRDVEVELEPAAAGHPLRPLLLPLLAQATTVTLTGLDRDAVGALMARTAGRRPADELVAEVHRRTGGNPFFVEQTARLWHAGG